MINTHTFRSNTKLLLTGEYFVLFGAKALAIPLKFSQNLNIEHNNSGLICWESYQYEQIWFSAKFSLFNFEVLETTSIDIASRLVTVFKSIQNLNPNHFNNTSGLYVTTFIDFDRNWGLGTSSTLLYNLSSWAKINPYKLNSEVSEGSGYDIACASAITPIFFKKNAFSPIIENVKLNDVLIENSYLIYSGNKQNTNNDINTILKGHSPKENKIELISTLSVRLTQCSSIQEIINCITLHEREIGAYINRKPVKDVMFSDFNGGIKSLGAWGGDFMLAISEDTSGYVNNYFSQKGYPIIFKMSEIICR